MWVSVVMLYVQRTRIRPQFLARATEPVQWERAEQCAIAQLLGVAQTVLSREVHVVCVQPANGGLAARISAQAILPLAQGMELVARAPQELVSVRVSRGMLARIAALLAQMDAAAMVPVIKRPPSVFASQTTQLPPVKWHVLVSDRLLEFAQDTVHAALDGWAPDCALASLDTRARIAVKFVLGALLLLARSMANACRTTRARAIRTQSMAFGQEQSVIDAKQTGMGHSATELAPNSTELSVLDMALVP